MRILHVTDTFEPVTGGIEVLIRALAERQAKGGHRVTVLARNPGPVDLDGRVVVERDRGRLEALIAGSDGVHAHVSAYSPLALRAAETAARSAVPVVATVHSMWTGAWPVIAAAARARGWLDLPIQWAAVSEAAAAPVRRALGGRAVMVLPNAIDTKSWSTDGRPSDSPSVTMVAVQRMTRRKRALPLVPLLAQVRDRVPADIQLRAVLVGEGPQHAALLRRINEFGIGSWVQAPGRMDHDEIRTLYRSAEIFLAPSTLESFGIAALEARAAGLAVFGRTGTGVGDFVADGRMAGSDAQMAAQLVASCADLDGLRAIQAHNRSIRPAYDWDDVLWRTEFAYETAGTPSGIPVPAGISGLSATVQP